MMVVLETAERQSTLSVHDTWPVPNVGHRIDWKSEAFDKDGIPKGLYRVDRVTHKMTAYHGGLRVVLSLERLNPDPEPEPIPEAEVIESPPSPEPEPEA